jgi:hypothetical protein
VDIPPQADLSETSFLLPSAGEPNNPAEKVGEKSNQGGNAHSND